MTIVRDKTQTLGSNCSWSHVFQTDLGKVDGYNAGHMLIKVDDYAQGFHLLEILCAAMSIALSYTVYDMLTPLPFDRGKMLSPHCPHAASLPISPRPFQASLVHLSLPPSRVLEGGYYCLWSPIAYGWGVINKPMGSINMHKIYCAQALAYHSEHLCLDPTSMWIAQDLHVLAISYEFKSSY